MFFELLPDELFHFCEKDVKICISTKDKGRENDFKD